MIRLALCLLLLSGVAYAQQVPKSRICDASGRCATVTTGKLDVNATVNATATTTATATAAPASCTEGQTDCPLSVDLSRNLRISGTINASSTATATAAAPTYGEGTAQPFSQDLAGWLRTRSLHTTAAAPLACRLSDGASFLSSLAVTGTFWQATQPISGTVTVTDGAGALNVIVDSGTTAATQSGTWTVQPGNTANTTAWLVTDSNDLTGYSTATSGLSTATTLTQIIAASGSNRVLIKNWKCSASAASTTTTDQQCTLKYGTGTNCATGTNMIDGCFQVANGGCNGQEIVIPASQAVCWIHAVAGSKIVTVTYKQIP